MPTYEYLCAACDHRLELFQSMTESPKKKCPVCGKLRLERQIGAGAGILFKGSGFYETDYRSASYKAGQAADKPGDAKQSDAKQSDAKSSESKPAADKPAKPSGGSKDSKP